MSTTALRPVELPDGAAERARLFAVCRKIESFLGGSELVFLETGTRLQALQASAQRLVGSSSAAADVGTAGAADPAEHLRHEVELLRGHLDHSRRATVADADGLARVLASVAALEQFHHGYHSLSSSLGLLAVQTRIESARHHAQLDRVATDTRRLAGQIEPKFAGVLAEAAQLGQVAASARSRTLAFLGQQGASGAEMLAETFSGLEALQALARSAAGLVEHAGETSRQVTARVSEVLVGLQVHDSTRQVFEHVAEELHELAADQDETGVAFFAEAASLCRLEARQLGQARARLVSGLEQITHGLCELAGGVSGLASEAQRVAGGKGGELLHAVERGVGASAHLLREQLASEKALCGAIHLVGQSLAGMESGVAQIERIGSEVKMISLNALVETSQASEGARIFEALAQAMTEAAKEVSQHNAAVTAALEKVASDVATLERENGQTLERETEEGSRIAAQLETLVGGLTSWHAALAARVAELQTGSAALGKEVTEAGEALTARAHAAAALAEVEQELEELAAGAERAAGPAAASFRSRRLELVAARYTMESERSVHVETQPEQQAQAQAAQVAVPAGAALGENVELF